MNKKQRLISKRQNIFNKKIKKPIRTFLENKSYNKVIKQIALFCRHYNLGAIINERKLFFIIKEVSTPTQQVLKQPKVGLSVNFSVTKNRNI